MKPHLEDYNSVYINFAGKEIDSLIRAHVLSRLDYLPQHEIIVYGWLGKYRFYGRGERSIWKIPKPRQSKLHPIMKPVELCARAIGNSSLPRDIVLDPFAGSGSTLIVCEHRPQGLHD